MPSCAPVAGFLQRLHVPQCGYCPWRQAASFSMLGPEELRAIPMARGGHDQETP
jgi:hypothetical protein